MSVGLGSPFIQGGIDFDSLRSKGWCSVQVTDFMTSQLRSCLREEVYVPDFEGKTDDGFDPSPTGYAGMYVPRDRMNERPGDFYEVWLEHLMAWASPLVGMYMFDPTGLDATLAIMQCRNGYYMDWHHDAGERAVAIALLYLNDSDVELEHGGILQISKTARDAYGEVIGREITGSVSPVNGTLVLLDATTIEFEHMVTEYKNKESYRFCLSAILGMPRRYHD